MSDSSAVIIWWVVITLLGLTSYPVTSLIFRRFADKGYIFSKILGILFSSYIVWLLASFHFLPFSHLTIIVVVLLLSIINVWIYKTIKDQQIPWGWVIIEELIFLGTLAFWSYIKANEPSIRGLEKFMDYGFVNSILRAQYFPPLDMWLTKSPDYTGGSFINYYYFGHYINAFLTKLSGIDSAITYNLMIATLFAFTFTLSFSIGMNFIYQILLHATESVKSALSHRAKPSALILVITGLLAAFIVTLGGNLHTIYVFTSGYPNEAPVPPWKLELGYHPERYWYPNATRFIAFTIHEFPIYSFVVSDLHGHVSDIPMVLLTIALLFALIISRDTKQKHGAPSFLSDFEKHTEVPLPILALLGILLAIMYMTNAWDGLIYMILAGLVILYLNFKYREENSSLLMVLYKTFSASLFLVFFFLIANLPFTFSFKPFVSGVGVLCAPAALLGKKIGPFLFEEGKCQKSPLYQLATLWGFFYYNVIGFLIFAIFPALRSFTAKASQIHESSRMKTRIHPNIFTRLFVFIRDRIRVIRELNDVDIFVLLLIFISTLLLIFPEFFYMKDIYPAHYRANTMFKLGYQAFMMLGLASGYIIMRISTGRRNKKITPGYLFYRFFYMLLFTLIAIYPYFAVNSYFGGLKNYQGLFGLNWMRTQYQDDYNAVMWIRSNIDCSNAPDCNNQPVIAEANGDSYTDYARVSANTGLPTIIGWPVHEWLWRGSYDEAGRRIPEVAAIYESTDLVQTKDILKKYNVSYIFVGALEREKYKNLDEQKIAGLGKVVFESGGTRVYKVNSQ